MEGTDDIYEVIKGNGFDEVGIGAEFISSFDIGVVIGRTEDDHGKAAQRIVATQPGKDIEPTQARHLEIEENEARHGIMMAVSELAGALEIGDGFVTISDALD